MSKQDKFPIQLSSSALTHPGKVRRQNEDTCFADDIMRCYMVADGIGGAAAGEVASACMKETVAAVFSGNKPPEYEELAKRIKTSFQEANTSIQAIIKQNPGNKGMGCTAEILAFAGSQCIIGHVGDSRVYRLRSGILQQLTKDHTLVQEQQDLKLIDSNQAASHPLRHVILRAVGNKNELDVDLVQDTPQPGDIYLLCTDGLTTMVPDGDIAEILAFDGPPRLKATMLVGQANDAGGKDNISVIVIEVHH